MWNLVGTPKLHKVTRALAREFAEMETIPMDRPLSERRLMVYERMLKKSEFRPVTWAKCYCRETESVYRVNGKHTSTLLSKIDPLPEFYAVVENYEADTLADVSSLYSTFDSRISVRNASDINRAFASAVPEFQAVPARIIDLIVAGLGYAKWQDTNAAHQATERAELLLDEVNFALWVNRILTVDICQKESAVLRRSPVVAAMKLTWDKSQRQSDEFWRAVRDETGASPTCPDRRLAKWLRMTTVNTGAGGRSVIGRKGGQREFFVKCLHAWNAYRRGTPTDLKYHAAAKIPAAV